MSHLNLRSSKGIAVISLDFSAQATCPRDRPNSPAQTLTECKAPRPFLRFRGSAAPSCRRRPGSDAQCQSPSPPWPATIPASSRNRLETYRVSSVIRTRRRKFRPFAGPRWASPRARPPGTLLSRPLHLAIAKVGPPARPASTAIIAMTTTLTSGCCRVDGRARVLQLREMDDDLGNPEEETLSTSAIVRSPFAAVSVTARRTLYRSTAQSASVTDYQNRPKCALALICDRVGWRIRTTSDGWTSWAATTRAAICCGSWRTRG